MNLNKAEIETTLWALQGYCEVLESTEETKWMAEDAGKLLTKIIAHLEQAEQKPQSFVKYTVTGSSSMTPDEIRSMFDAISITTGEFALESDFGSASFNECRFELESTEWIAEEKEMSIVGD